jgi:DNA replication protein DnaC
MLTSPLIDQLRTLKLTGMLEGLSEQLQQPQIGTLSFEERLGLLLDREYSVRTNRLLQSRLKQAKLHISQATLADIDYSADRQLDKRQIAALSMGGWLEQRQNLILTGATGTGKSYLACALGHKACILGFRAQYWRVTRLLEELTLAKADGRYLNVLKALARLHVLILDDWGMIKLQGQHQQLLLDVLDDRYQKASTVITSQLPVTAWYEQVQDKTFADAILDRLLGQAQVIQLSGASLRKRQEVK